jgi:K+-sensing histidine kinase KdpD
MTKANQELSAQELGNKISHDLGGPLTSLLGAIGLLKKMHIQDETFPEVLNLLELSYKRFLKMQNELSEK